MRAKKKLFALAHRGGIKAQNTLDESVSFGREAIGGADLRDQANLLSVVRTDGLAQQNERKGEAGKGVFTEIGHDGGWSKAVAHLGESQRNMLGDEGEVRQNGKAEAEAEGVALDLRDADQRSGAQGSFELEDTSRFAADCCGSAGGALAAGAEDIAARPKAQNACARL